jgi:hypothetical protein
MSELLSNEPEFAKPPASDYECYEALLEPLNVTHPARQGMSQEEFEAAVQDPDAAKTDILVEGELRQIPQLVPIDRFEWLNGGFYAGKFPEETEREAVMHFADFPEIVEPGLEVQERLTQLAEQEGVVVFDFPSNDPEYPERVLSTLDELGITVADTQELGTQTYYVGQAVLKREHEELEQPLGLIKAFQKKVYEDTYNPARLHNGASLHQVIDPHQAQNMYEFYDEAFQALNEASPVRQGLTPDEFLEMVVNDPNVAKIVSTSKGEITALCLLSDDLTRFDWINPEFFENAFPDKSEKKQIIYFPALAADPSKLGANTMRMVGLMTELVEAGDNETVIAFDCCDLNKGFLDKFLGDLINRSPEVDINIRPAGVQHYMALKLQKPEQETVA